MEYVILGAIIVAFSSISSQLSSIKNKMDNQTKSKINLKDYLGKKVKLYLDDEYDIELIGEYTGRHNSIKVRCKICGYEWEPRFSSLLRGSSHKNAKTMHKNK